jgi:hypothetical protein
MKNKSQVCWPPNGEGVGVERPDCILLSSETRLPEVETAECPLDLCRL